MKILILGGTGAMGTHLVSVLGENNCTVTTRSFQKEKNGVNYVIGNAHDLTFLSPLLYQRKWDTIVDFMFYSTEEFNERYELYLNSTIQYVFLSSSRVYAKSATPITEESPRLLDVCRDEDYLKTDEYALAKARQEDILKNSGRRNWTIIRPYVTFSEIRLQLSALEKEYWLYRALKGRTIVFSKDIAEKITTITYGYDVARGIAAVIGKQSVFGEIFTITTNESYKWSEIFDLYLDIIEKWTGIRPKILWLDQWIPGIGGSSSQVKWDRLYDRTFNNSKIGKYIDTTTFENTMPALTKCLQEFLSKPYFREIDWVSEAVKDRMTGEWSNFSEIIGVKQKIKYFIVRIGLYSRN